MIEEIRLLVSFRAESAERRIPAPSSDEFKEARGPKYATPDAATAIRVEAGRAHWVDHVVVDPRLTDYVGHRVVEKHPRRVGDDNFLSPVV